MEPMTVLALASAIGAGLGAMQAGEEKKAAKRARKQEAEIAKWSPWTGVAPQRVQEGPGTMGRAIQGGLSGAMFGSMLGQSMGQSSPAPQPQPQSTWSQVPTIYG